MEYRIVEKPPVTLVGKALRVGTKDGENMRRIPQFWAECLQDGSHDQLLAFAKRGETFKDTTLGVCTGFDPNMEEFTYLVAAEAPAEGAPAGMVEQSIPALTWAVFEGKGALPESIQSVWGYISSEFFANTQFKHANGPDLEIYPPGNPMQADYRFEIWVPVAKQ